MLYPLKAESDQAWEKKGGRGRGRGRDPRLGPQLSFTPNAPGLFNHPALCRFCGPDLAGELSFGLRYQ